uniref:Pro-neuregulin-4, membrane-bound isoform n=1 Tax=Sus scrofa TaxID=9823 RepID=A0A4X1TVV4_PIG
MPTDHEEPCGPSHRSFCLNGGICYVIPTIPSPFCRCIENYTGARCEEVFLPSSSIQTESDLFTTFAALAVLLGTLIIGVLYFLCRSCRTLKKYHSELKIVASLLQRQKMKHHTVKESNELILLCPLNKRLKVIIT